MQELREYPVGKVCRILKVSRSSYYDTLRNGQRRREHKAEERQAVYEAFHAHHGSFGRRMLRHILQQRGIQFSEYKISKIMKELGFSAKYGRKRCKNVHTSQNTEKYIADNLFAALTPEKRRQLKIWSMDFTEQKVDGKKVYTCGIISVNDKILTGFAQASSCTSALACKAVRRAVAAYGAPDIIMTDRGAQFTSRDFHDMMQGLAIRHSMSRPHKPVANRFIETFWKSMKVEIGRLDLLNPETYRMVVEYYVYYYNHLRPHSSLGYRPPAST